MNKSRNQIDENYKTVEIDDSSEVDAACEARFALIREGSSC